MTEIGVDEGIRFRDASDEWTKLTAVYGRTSRLQSKSGDDERPVWVTSIAGKDENKPTIFFLHGLGGRSEQFIEEIKYFSGKGFPCIAIDMIGHGHSSKPRGLDSYTTEELVHDMRTLIIQQANSCGSLIVAHSLGTVVTLKLVVDEQFVREYKILGACLLGSVTGRVEPPAVLSCCDCFLEMIRPIVSRISRRQLYHPSTNQEFVLQESGVVSQNPWYVVRGLVFGMQFPSKDELQQIGLPLLMLHGETDRVNRTSNAETLSREFKNAEFKVIAASSHNIHQEKPEEVNRLIEQFLSELPK